MRLPFVFAVRRRVVAIARHIGSHTSSVGRPDDALTAGWNPTASIAATRRSRSKLDSIFTIPVATSVLNDCRVAM